MVTVRTKIQYPYPRDSKIIQMPFSIKILPYALPPPHPAGLTLIGDLIGHLIGVIGVIFTYLEIVDVLSLYKTQNKHICSVLFCSVGAF